MRNRCSSVLPLLFALLTASANRLPAQSQATTGSIEGTVMDASGRSIPGAKITLVNTGTNFTRELVTDTEGRFRGLLLPLGAYKVTVTAANFGRLVREGVTLAVGQAVIRRYMPMGKLPHPKPGKPSRSGANQLIDLTPIAQECASTVAIPTLQALIRTESGFNPLAIHINGGSQLARQPSTKAEASSWASWLLARGYDNGPKLILSLGSGHPSSVEQRNPQQLPP